MRGGRPTAVISAARMCVREVMAIEVEGRDGRLRAFGAALTQPG
ncbi:hypothetical protein [Streptomyces sp. NBC_00690]|nr:hypothetical protein [Streptomyces sp. NBC_00690]